MEAGVGLVRDEAGLARAVSRVRVMSVERGACCPGWSARQWPPRLSRRASAAAAMPEIRDLQEIRDLMEAGVGLVRDEAGLARAVSRLAGRLLPRMVGPPMAAAALAPGKRRRRHEEPGDGLRGTLTQAFATADALATADAVARPSSLVEATR
jgi:hypothetical protein